MGLDGGKYIVTILTEDGVTHTRFVTVGLVTPTDVWILQGLNEGDTVIID